MTFPGPLSEPPADNTCTCRMPNFPRLVDPAPLQDPALGIDPVDAHAADAIAICNGPFQASVKGTSR